MLVELKLYLARVVWYLIVIGGPVFVAWACAEQRERERRRRDDRGFDVILNDREGDT